MEISNNLLNVLTKTADILNNLEIEYCLIGGLAVSMLSRPRATEDVDFLVLINEIDKIKIVKALEKEFKIIQSKEQFSLKGINIWRVIVAEKATQNYDFIILDFILGETAIHKDAIKSCLSIKIAGTAVNVVNKESLIKIKKDSGCKIDLMDIENLKTCDL